MARIVSFVAIFLFCSQIHAKAQVIEPTMSDALETGDHVHLLYAVNNGGLGGPPFFPGQAGAAALNTNRTRAQSWETFKLIQLNPQEIELRTSGGDWVTAVDNGGIGGPNDNTSPIHSDAISKQGAATTFIITPMDAAGDVTIQTCDGHFLTANNGGGFSGPDSGPGVVPIHTDVPISKAAGDWEIFSLLPAPTCAFNQIEIEGQTGFDNADRNLAISASINGLAGEICLKTSNDRSLGGPPTFRGVPSNSPWAGCPAGGPPNSSFAIGSRFDTGKITLLNPLPITAFSTMTIHSVQSGCTAFCANWALQSVSVVVSNSFGLVQPEVLLSIPSAGNPTSNNCIAYFKAAPNATEAKFSLTGLAPLATWVDGIQPGQPTSCNPP